MKINGIFHIVTSNEDASEASIRVFSIKKIYVKSSKGVNLLRSLSFKIVNFNFDVKQDFKKLM